MLWHLFINKYVWLGVVICMFDVFQILKQLRFTRCNPISQFFGLNGIPPGTKCNPMLSGRRLPIAPLTFLQCVFSNKRMKSDTALLHNWRNPMLSSVPNVKRTLLHNWRNPMLSGRRLPAYWLTPALGRCYTGSPEISITNTDLHILITNTDAHIWKKYRCKYSCLSPGWFFYLGAAREKVNRLYIWLSCEGCHWLDIGGKTVRIVKFYYMFSTSSSFTPSLLNIKKVVRCPASVT